MTLQDDLTNAVGALATLAGAANYALAGYQLTDEAGPLERALDAIATAFNDAMHALDELQGQSDATVTQLHGDDEPPWQRFDDPAEFPLDIIAPQSGVMTIDYDPTVTEDEPA